MINQIHISKLSEIKSVFNSPSDNEQYYKILKNSNLNINHNIELAQPSIRQSNFSIIWKTTFTGQFKNFNHISLEKQQEVGVDLEKFYSNFTEKTKQFKNIPSDFSEKIIQIPSLDSIFVNDDTGQVVIVNWGFLEDTYNRKEGVINKLFPTPNKSILVKLVDQFNNPLVGAKLDFTSERINENSVTNSNGYAKFSNHLKGNYFKIKTEYPPFYRVENDFTCDGRKEYIIQVNVDHDPDFDTTIDISNINIIEDETSLEDLNDKKNNFVKIRFVNTFNKAIKNLEVKITDNENNESNYVTNENGEITLDIDSNDLEISCFRKKKSWNYSINTSQHKNHIIQLKPIFPWLWWLLLLILSLILICCLFFNCFCEWNRVNPISEIINEQAIPTIPCNSTNDSGGEGLTSNIHYLGEMDGLVNITFDMQNVPDKLEVFYEEKLVASTHNIPGNDDGFVGGSLSSGCCGKLSFDYKKNKDDFCTVVITGNLQTFWNYSISCPF